MMLITDLSQIREMQTVETPNHDDVRLAFPQYLKGWVTAVYDRRSGKWCYGYMETKDEVTRAYETLKEICKFSPELFDFSEMYIYHSIGETKARWSLYGVAVDK